LTTSRVTGPQRASDVHFLDGRPPVCWAGGRTVTDVRLAFETLQGRCLRPALYSSLRSSPSHPAGVSALRVTIAIANARFARKQWGLRKSTAKVAAALSQWIGRQPTCSGQALLDDHRKDPNCILSQIAASTESLLAWKLGPRNQCERRVQDKANLRSPLPSVEKACLHIGLRRRRCSPTRGQRRRRPRFFIMFQ
jgi:hypothetical protein